MKQALFTLAVAAIVGYMIVTLALNMAGHDTNTSRLSGTLDSGSISFVCQVVDAVNLEGTNPCK